MRVFLFMCVCCLACSVSGCSESGNKQIEAAPDARIITEEERAKINEDAAAAMRPSE